MIAFILSSIPQALIAIVAGGFAVVIQLTADVPEPALQVPILFAEQLVGTFALFFQLIRTGQDVYKRQVKSYSNLIHMN